MTQRPTDDTESTAWVYASGAAEILGVSIQTLRRRSDSGEIPCHRPWRGAHRRYRVADLEALTAPVTDQRAAS